MPEPKTSKASTQSDSILRFAEWHEPLAIPIEISPDATQQWSVTFDVLLGNWIIGTDEGILWFDRQNLYVVGKLTSFAVPGHRISDSFERRFSAIRPFQRQIHVPLVAAPGFPLAIQLDISVAHPFVPENIALLDCLRFCRNHADPETEGQLPPIRAWKNAHTLNQILAIQSKSLIGLAVAALLTGVFILLIERDFGLNPILILVILLCAAIQFYRWVSPKLFISARAARSYKTYSGQAKAPDMSGEAT